MKYNRLKVSSTSYSHILSYVMSIYYLDWKFTTRSRIDVRRNKCNDLDLMKIPEIEDFDHSELNYKITNTPDALKHIIWVSRWARLK
jgi:hypothetical protein